MNVLSVLITVAALLLLAIPGFIFAKLKMFGENASQAFSVMVLYGCQPVMIIVCFQETAFNPDLGLNMLYVFLLAVAVHLIMFGLLFLCLKKAPKTDKTKIIKYAGAFSNCGFMGIPFIQTLFSDSAVKSEILIYGAIIIAVFNVFNWTMGVYIMTGDVKKISAKKVALNPVIISVILGFLLFIVLKKPIVDLAEEGTTLHTILSRFMGVLNIISETVTPLSLTVIGIKLANINLKKLFLDGTAYLAVVFKNVVMPVIAILIVAFLPISSAVKYTVFFLLAMPSATGTALFSVKFGLDADFASVCVILSTVLSVATIPLLFLFINGALGVAI